MELARGPRRRVVDCHDPHLRQFVRGRWVRRRARGIGWGWPGLASYGNRMGNELILAGVSVDQYPVLAGLLADHSQQRLHRGPAGPED